MKMLKGLALAAAVATSASAAQAAEFNWRVANFDKETGAYWNNFILPFVGYVEQFTDGRVKLDPLPGGTLGNIFKIYEQVDDGLVEMAVMPPAFLGTKDPTNAMVLGFPSGLGVDSFITWLYYGGGEDLLRGHRADRMKMHSFVVGAGPSEFFAHSHIPVTKVEDLKNAKYRTLGNWAAIVKSAFGASPTTVPGPEIYGMLEKRGIDMTEYSTPSENMKLGYQEVAEYIIYPGIHAGAWAFEGVVKLDKWAELPEDLQKKIELAGRLATYEGLQRFIAADLDAMDKLSKGKNKFIQLSPEFQQASQDAARAWAKDVAAKAAADGNPWPEKIIASITSFQDKYRANSKYMVVDHRDK
ncbi:MAG: TRAP transporter substrate-binding protein DctP [Alphaproteobacteria bacterium]